MPSGKEVSRDPFATGLRLLARRPYSVAELRRALQKKFVEKTAVANAIARLRQLGYLDDRKFAEQYASSLARNRAWGRYRVRRELKAKLVDYRHIDPAVRQAFEETDEHELLQRVIAKKVRSLRLPVTASKLSSLCQSLMRRGFPADDIMKAVRSRSELKPVADHVDLSEIEAAGQD